MSTLTVSLVQMDVRKGAPRINWTAVQEHSAEAARRGADLVVFPELWDAGSAFENAKEYASSLSGGLFAQVVALARQYDIHILGSMYEKRGVGIYNTIAVISPRNGVMGAYRKIHLFPLAEEDKWLQPGEAPLAIDLPWGRTALAICYDLRFPELFRRYAAEGAHVVVMPMAWPHPYFGHSSVIDPWGEAVIEAGEVPGHFTITVDLSLVTQVRRHLPALDGRRL
jgi:omega-amidase